MAITPQKTIRRKPHRHRSTKVEVQALAARAMEHVRSVDYRVSLRWVFYRLLQDGLLESKASYKNFTALVSRWRHLEIGGWDRGTLDDTTRQAIYRGQEESTPIEDMAESIIYNLPLWTRDSHFNHQAHYVEVWFEARAMIEQFRKYTDAVTLRPFGGYTSIPFKATMAADLDKAAERFGKPIVILYFGDCDDDGRMIKHSSVDGPKGLRKWCAADFEVKWCGLTEDQARRYHVQEDPEHPGKYQWEALGDDEAREIIQTTVAEYIDAEAIKTAETESEAFAEKVAVRIRKAFEGVETEADL